MGREAQRTEMSLGQERLRPLFEAIFSLRADLGHAKSLKAWVIGFGTMNTSQKYSTRPLLMRKSPMAFPILPKTQFSRGKFTLSQEGFPLGNGVGTRVDGERLVDSARGHAGWRGACKLSAGRPAPRGGAVRVAPRGGAGHVDSAWR
jgi:hypothetical protein